MKDKLADLHYYDCLRTNKSMMASGVETRVPFLDANLIEIAMTIPVKMKHPKFIKVYFNFTSADAMPVTSTY